MLLFKYIATSICVWCVNGIYITFRDHDLVGEDPVLMAELARRMARSAPPPSVYKTMEESPPPATPPDEGKLPFPEGAKGSPLLKGAKESIPPEITGLTPSPTSDHRLRNESYRRVHEFPNPYDQDAYTDLNAALAGQKGGKHEYKYKGLTEESPNFKEIPMDYNGTQLYALQLKVAEQSIYGVQMRLEELEKIVKPHKQDPMLRMAYAFKRLERWEIEMKDLFHYSHQKKPTEFVASSSGDKWWHHPKSFENPFFFPIPRHIMYYEAILRRYIDVINTVDYIHKTHTIEMAKAKADNFDELFKGGSSNTDKLSLPPVPPS